MSKGPKYTAFTGLALLARRGPEVKSEKGGGGGGGGSEKIVALQPGMTHTLTGIGSKP